MIVGDDNARRRHTHDIVHLTHLCALGVRELALQIRMQLALPIVNVLCATAGITNQYMAIRAWDLFATGFGIGHFLRAQNRPVSFRVDSLHLYRPTFKQVVLRQLRCFFDH